MRTLFHRDLHNIPYYFNPHFEYYFRHDDLKVKNELYIGMRRLVNDVA